MRRFELEYAGHPRQAPPSVLRAALERRDRSSRPEVQQRFLDLDAAELDALEPEFFEALSRSFAPPTALEPERLYCGFRCLETAQRAILRLPPMFVTSDLEEAHRYSNDRSVVLCFSARRSAHVAYDNPYGAAEYKTGRDARADGLRVIGVIRGQGPWRNPSALGGTSYD